MKYTKPTIQLNEAQASSMLAESLSVVSDKTVDGSEALTKEDEWNIWSDEE